MFRYFCDLCGVESPAITYDALVVENNGGFERFYSKKDICLCNDCARKYAIKKERLLANKTPIFRMFNERPREVTVTYDNQTRI